MSLDATKEPIGAIGAGQIQAWRSTPRGAATRTLGCGAPGSVLPQPCREAAALTSAAPDRDEEDDHPHHRHPPYASQPVDRDERLRAMTMESLAIAVTQITAS